MIERYLLRYFLAVIDQGNFSKAAMICNVSQPTLSVGIAKLENNIGQTLFRRTNRRVELTESGARLAPLARRIEAEFAHAEREVSKTSHTSTLRIGLLTSTPDKWTESLLGSLSSLQADRRIELVEGRERDLVERLTRSRIDVALTLIQESENRFACQPLFTEGYSVAMSKRHRLAGREQIEPEELTGETMIVRRHCEALVDTSRFFTAHGVRPFFAARTTDESRALTYVRSGLGITVMPDCFEHAEIVRPRLSGFNLTRTLGFLFASYVDPSDIGLSMILDAIASAITPDLADNS